MHKINEPAVINVYNEARKAFQEKQARYREEMQESVLERNIDEENAKKISVIERKADTTSPVRKISFLNVYVGPKFAIRCG